MTPPAAAAAVRSAAAVWSKHHGELQPLTRRNLRRFEARCGAVYVFVGYVLYAPTCATVLRTFDCVRYGGDGSYMRHDVALRCAEPNGTADTRYMQWAAFAGMATALLVVGLPITNLLLVLRVRATGQLHTSQRRAALGLLYEKYTDESCWWDAIETLKRLAFSGALILLPGVPAASWWPPPLLRTAHAVPDKRPGARVARTSSDHAGGASACTQRQAIYPRSAPWESLSSSSSFFCTRIGGRTAMGRTTASLSPPTSASSRCWSLRCSCRRAAAHAGARTSPHSRGVLTVGGSAHAGGMASFGQRDRAAAAAATARRRSVFLVGPL